MLQGKIQIADDSVTFRPFVLPYHVLPLYPTVILPLIHASYKNFRYTIYRVSIIEKQNPKRKTKIT